MWLSTYRFWQHLHGPQLGRTIATTHKFRSWYPWLLNTAKRISEASILKKYQELDLPETRTRHTLVPVGILSSLWAWIRAWGRKYASWWNSVKSIQNRVKHWHSFQFWPKFDVPGRIGCDLRWFMRKTHRSRIFSCSVRKISYENLNTFEQFDRDPVPDIS